MISLDVALNPTARPLKLECVAYFRSTQSDMNVVPSARRSSKKLASEAAYLGAAGLAFA